MSDLKDSATVRPESEACGDGFVARLRRWMIDHDDSWLFIGSYVVLAVVLSIAISLFWLVVVVAIHGLFEWVRQSQSPYRDRCSIVVRIGWELKLDIALVLFALVLAVYMDVILGAAGLGSAARLGIQAGARFTGWQSVLRGFLLSVDDAAHVVRAISGSSRSGAQQLASGADAQAQVPEHRRWGGWTQQRWGVGDWLALSLLAICCLLMLTSPWLSPHDLPDILEVLTDELHPWPTAGSADGS